MNPLPFIIFATAAYLWLFYSLAILARREALDKEVYVALLWPSITLNLSMYLSYRFFL